MKEKKPLDSDKGLAVLNIDKDGNLRLSHETFDGAIVEDMSVDIPDGVVIPVSDNSLPANRLIKTSYKIPVVLDSEVDTSVKNISVLGVHQTVGSVTTAGVIADAAPAVQPVYTNPRIHEVIAVAGMIPATVIPYEEAPIIDIKPDAPVLKNPVSAPKLPASKDYEIYAKEAPIANYPAEVDFPVAPVAVLHGESVTIEPIEKEIAPESTEMTETAAVNEAGAPEDVRSSKEAKKETKAETVAEPSGEKKKKPVQKNKPPKVVTPPRERPKPTYDLSKIVFPGEKKKPVKVKSKVVIKMVREGDNSSEK